MQATVCITGMGIISALGNNLAENIAALRADRSGIALPQFLETIHRHAFVTGEVKLSNRDLAQQTGQPADKLISRTALLGLHAAKEAVNNAGLEEQEFRRCRLINGTSVGGMDVSERYYLSLKKGSLNGKVGEVFSGHDCGASTEFMADALGIKGNISTISTACSSSANAIMQAGRLIKAGLADCVIAGGTDALSLFTLNGFNALKILDPEWCKPFDINRKGLNLGEGAAYLVLESEEHAQNRKASVLAKLIGYGNANDAYHQTASSPEGKGAYLAMHKAIGMAQEPGLQIDYINAHGTGTHNNDLSESMALKEMFGEAVPAYSSTKSFTGHTLGAAGAIEAVFSVSAIQQNLKYRNCNLSQPMDVLAVNPLSSLKMNATVNHVLSNSFGFGGNCTSLLFSR